MRPISECKVSLKKLNERRFEAIKLQKLNVDSATQRKLDNGKQYIGKVVKVLHQFYIISDKCLEHETRPPTDY